MAYQIQGSVIINDSRELVNVGASTISTLSVTSATTTEDLVVNGSVSGTAGILTTGSLGGPITIGGSLTADSAYITNDVQLGGKVNGPGNLIIDPAPLGGIGGTVSIKGDLVVEGTEFIVESTTVSIADKKIGIASATATNILLDGAGIGIGSGVNEKTFLYNNTSGVLESNTGLGVTAGDAFKIGNDEVLSSGTLGSTILASSLTSVGTLTDVTVAGDINANGNIVGDSATQISGIATVTVSGGVVAGFFYGDGSNLTNLSAQGIDLTGTDQSFRHVQVTGAGIGLTVTNDVEVGGTAIIDTLVLTNTLAFVGATEAIIGVATVNTSLDVNGPTDLVDVQVSGAASITGDLTVTGDITANGNIVGDSATNISGIASVTATNFYGDGSGLTNLPATGIDLSGTDQSFNTVAITTTTGVGLDVTGRVAIGGTVSFATTAYFTTDTVTTGETVGFGSAFFGDILANNLDLSSGDLTGDDSTNISGIASVTATNFYGDGSGLTGVVASGSIAVANNGTYVGAGFTILNVAPSDGIEVAITGTTGAAATITYSLADALSFGALELTAAGVALTVTNDVSVGGDLAAANVSASSSVTATSFYGDGSNITGISADDSNGILVADNQDNTDYPMIFASAVGAGASIYSDSTTSFEFTYNPSTGTATAATFDSVSDERLKDNITEIADPVAKLAHLRGVEFDWKGIEGSSVGVIAQDVAKVYPQLVTDHGERLTVNYDGLVGLLVRAVQELTARVEELEGK